MERLILLPRKLIQLLCILMFLSVFSYDIHAYEGDYLYLLVEGGASIARKLHISPASPWDGSPDGYNDKLRNSEVLGAGIGYHLCPILSGELVIDHRNSFKYNKFQRSSDVGGKIRFFNLKSTTLMANLIGHGNGLAECLSYTSDNISIDPFINAGIGVSYNTVDNFHTLQVPGGKVYSIMHPYTQTNMAYQLGFGIQITTCDLVSLALGYRYLAAGKFRSNDYLIDNPISSPAATSGIPAPSWVGKLKANEFYVKLIFFVN